MKVVLPAYARSQLESRLPDDVDAVWFSTSDAAGPLLADAQVAWLDLQPASLMRDAVTSAGPGLKWISTIYAGLDAFPLDELRRRGIAVTNGAGINAIAVAEYAVMGMLVGAKRFDAVLRAHDRHEWLTKAPGRLELYDTRALVVGYGAIGTLIGDRLSAFGVAVTGVTRSGRDGTLTPDRWRERLGEFDWIVLAAPSTDDTKALIGVDELAAMKPGAWIVNIARGDMIDDRALIAALESGRLGGAFLDPTSPEPLPPGHPLWSAPRCIVTMHLSGRSQTRMVERAAALFLRNLAAWRGGAPLENVADLSTGY